MVQKATYDLRSNLKRSVSIKPGTAYDPGTDINGLFVDIRTMEGPLAAIFTCGAATGSPTAQTVKVTMQQADDATGTNVESCPIQSASALTADNSVDVVRFQAGRPFVRAIIDDSESFNALTGGTDPTLPVSCVICGQAESVGTYADDSV